jgi:hypothetical protein
MLRREDVLVLLTVMVFFAEGALVDEGFAEERWDAGRGAGDVGGLRRVVRWSECVGSYKV